MSLAGYEQRMVARVAPASPGFTAVPYSILVAAAAGKRVVADSRNEHSIARDRAMLCSYASARAWSGFGVAVFVLTTVR